jgi:hypothetical protein
LSNTFTGVNTFTTENVIVTSNIGLNGNLIITDYSPPVLLNAYTLSFLNGINTATSSNGRYLGFCFNGGIYTSSDYGVTMTRKSIDAKFSALSMSATGQYQACLYFHTVKFIFL